MKIFKWLGQAIGFALSVGLWIEGVPNDPEAVARDVGRIFDNGGTNLLSDIFDIAGHMSPWASEYDMLKSYLKNFFDEKTVAQILEQPEFKRAILPQFKQLFKSMNRRTLAKRANMRTLVYKSRGRKLHK